MKELQREFFLNSSQNLHFSELFSLGLYRGLQEIPDYFHHCLRIKLAVLEQVPDLLLTLIWFR